MTGCFQCDNGTLVCRCGLITQQEGDAMKDATREARRAIVPH